MTVYHSHPKFSHRPHNFRRVLDHPLWDGCVFAGLGNVAGGEYLDTSVVSNSTDHNCSWAQWSGRNIIHPGGTNQRVNSYIDFDPQPPLTISAWMYFASSIETYAGVSINVSTSDTQQYFIGARSSGNGIGGWVRNGGTFLGGTVPNADGWNHVSAVYPNNSQRFSYVNGGITNTERTPISPISPDKLWVGGLGDFSPNYYDVPTGDVLVHTRELTQSEAVRLADPSNTMLDGAIEPIPTATYFLPQPSIPPVDKAFIPYHHQPKHSHRPNNFRRVLDHPLWDGCKYAALGALPGNTWLTDSTVNQVPGVGTGKAESVQGRVLERYDGSPDYGRIWPQDDGKSASYFLDSAFTSSAWIVPDVTSRGDVFGLWNGTGARRWILLQGAQADSYSFYCYRAGFDVVHSTATITTGKLTHLCGVHDGSNVYFYVDGMLQGTVASGQLTHVENAWTEIGRSDINANYFRGLIGDLMYWDKALDASAVARLADPSNIMLDGAIEPIPTNTYFLPKPSIPPVDKAFIPYHHQPKYSHRPNNFRRVLDHPLWDGCVFAGLGAVSGSERYEDTSAKQIDGVLTNMDHTTDWVDGPLGRRALSFGGGSEHVAFDQSPLDESSMDAFSLVAWAKPLGGSRAETLLCVSEVELAGSWFVTLGAFYGDYRFNRRASANDNIIQGTPTGGWDCVIGVARAANDAELYVNGSSVGTSATSVSSYLLDSNTIGGLRRSDGVIEPCEGLVSDCFIYDRAISLSEIARFSDPSNVMLDGAIEPIPTNTYFIPVGTTPPPTGGKTRILRSRIIRGVM